MFFLVLVSKIAEVFSSEGSEKGTGLFLKESGLPESTHLLL